MNRVNYFVIAGNVIEGSQGVTLVNIFNSLNAETLPIVKPKIYIAFGFSPAEDSLVDNKIKITVQITDPKGKTIANIVGTGSRDANTDEKEPELTGVIDLSDGLILEYEGTYRTKLICGKDEVIAENKFTVQKD